MIYSLAGHELDLPAMELRRGGRAVPMEPQVFDVLAYLVDNHDRLVSRHELLDAVWGHRFVTEATLSSRVMAARRAIGDSGREQRVIRTVRGRGFRVVADVSKLDDPPPSGARSAEAREPPAVDSPVDAPALLGRARELGHLRRLAAESLAGARRLVLVSGETGIGKSALVKGLMADPVIPADAVALRCRCMERRGSSEPYMAVLDGIASACGAPGGGLLAAELAWRAPSWMVQMPWLLRLEEVVDVPDPIGVTPERMLREIIDALEAISLDRPVVMIIEDAHLAGPATLDVLAMLATRDTPARLLLLATASPGVDQESGFRAVQRDLRAGARSVELALAPLGQEAVAAYLVARLGEPAGALAGTLAARSGGNPLFMRQIVDWWVERGLALGADPGVLPSAEDLEVGIPETLRDFVERRLEHLDEEDLAVVEAAAIVGPEPAAASVAAAAERKLDETEDRLDRLARASGLLVELGSEVWPDGTVAGRYGFTHEVLREALEDRLSPGRRARAHQRVADRLVTAYGSETAARAAEVAGHLLAARDAEAAVPYVRIAAERALARSAPRDALAVLERGLAAVRATARRAARDRAELSLEAPRAVALLALRGWGAPEPLTAFERARELAERVGGPGDVSSVLYGLAAMHEYRGEHGKSAEVLRARLAIPGPEVRAESLELLACACFHQGEFTTSIEKANEGLLEGAGAQPSALLAALGEDARVGCMLWAARSKWFLGFPDTALADASAALELSAQHAYGRSSALTQLAMVHQQRQEPGSAREVAASAITVATEGGYAYPAAVARIVRGWADAMLGHGDEALAEIEAGIDAHAETGAGMDRPYFLGLLAEAQIASGRPDAAEQTLQDALAADGEERRFFFDPELWRLLAVVLRSRGQAGAADRAMGEARRLALAQGSRSLQLRIATDLASHPARAGARNDLESILRGFEEGQETPDQRRARTALSGAS